MLDSILDSLQVLTFPTKTDFRSIKEREVALFQGPMGWAEFSPFLEYGAQECVPWLVSGIEAAFLPAPTALRNKIPINATLPAVNESAKIAEVLSWFPGCEVVKIKVGENLAEDLARIREVRRLLPGARIRIDVNGSWSVEYARTALAAIYEEGDLEYVEQPCQSLEELRELKQRLTLPILIAADEVIRKSSQPLSLELAGAVDIVMLKVAPLGGIRASLEIAEKYGLPVVVSSALESAVGISYGLNLAAALPD